MVRAVIRIGDEVAYVGPPAGKKVTSRLASLKIGSVHTVLQVLTHPDGSGRIGLVVAANLRPIFATSFRKVQRRDLQAWLQTAVPAPHLDKRKRKRVSA